MYVSQCGISLIFVSQIFGKIIETFRENNTVKGLYSKMALGMARFSIFGANLRKFYLFDIKSDTLDNINHLRPLRRMVQKDLYRCLKLANFNL